MMNLIYLMDHILFQTFKIILSTSLKNSAEVVLVYCNLVSNNYQQASKVLLTFVPNK